MRFFSQFPRTDYKIGRDLYSTSVIDIFRHIDVDESLIDDLTTYTYYNIKDGERPDVVSHKLYNSAEYHWTFFIINDTLKTGLNNWPRSFNEQAEYIENKYDRYSVLEFLPSQEFKNDNSEGVPNSFVNGIKYHNYFNDIDFSDSRVVLRNIGNNYTADTVIYDSDRLQMWVDSLEHAAFLSNDEAKYVLDYKRDDPEALEEWATNVALPFVKKFHPGVYDDLVEDERLDYDNVLPFIRGSRDDGESDDVVGWNRSCIIRIEGNIDDIDDYVIDDKVYDVTRGTFDDYGNLTVNDLLISEYLADIEFTTSRSWLKSYNAPYEYFDPENGNYMTTYDKLKVAPDSDDYITYIKAEENENEERSRIRVLRKVDVEAFAERYKELINE